MENNLAVPWKCQAKPVALGGKTCGHLNEKEFAIRGLGGKDLIYCASCGCTKIAGELRKAKEKEDAKIKS